MTRLALPAIACALMAGGLHAQALSFPTPVIAGTTVPITLTNDTGSSLVIGAGGNKVALLRPRRSRRCSC